jgi:hypothetical protein
MIKLRRLAIDLQCPECSRTNTVLLPEASCGNEFVWHARCAACGGWRWFHSREDPSFVLAVKETARRRNEMGGLSKEGTREAHAAFEATVDPCGCGGRFKVVMKVQDVPCTGCGRLLQDAPLPEGTGKPVDVPPLRASK